MRVAALLLVTGYALLPPVLSRCLSLALSPETLSLSGRSTTSNTSSSSTTTILPYPPSPLPTSPPEPTPTPLDLSISYALSNACLLYLTALLRSSTFLSCLPLSLLMTTSSGYSTLLSTSIASGNYTTLNNLVGYTSEPQPSGSECDTYLLGVLADFGSKANCQADVQSGNVVALQAAAGLGNYQVVREASGLLNSQGVYCYLEALSSARPDDLYLWGIPGGVSLPPTSTPTCSQCSALLLNHYAAASTLNATLVQNAANTVNAACGHSFVTVNTTATGTRSSSGSVLPPLGAATWTAMILGLVTVLAV